MIISVLTDNEIPRVTGFEYQGLLSCLKTVLPTS